MGTEIITGVIEKIAREFGNAVAAKNHDEILSFFADDCEVELLGIKLKGKTGAKKWIRWMYEHMSELDFSPVVTMTDGNTYFEEYILNGKLHNGIDIQSRQSEVLVFENDKIKSFRIYLDRLEFADSVVNDFAGKMIVRGFKKKSLGALAR